MKYCPRISSETRNINLKHKPRTMRPKVSWCCFFIMSACCSQDNKSFQFLFSSSTCCFSLKLSCSAFTLPRHLFGYNLLQEGSWQEAIRRGWCFPEASLNSSVALSMPEQAGQAGQACAMSGPALIYFVPLGYV